jgi:hypothetical protein
LCLDGHHDGFQRRLPGGGSQTSIANRLNDPSERVTADPAAAVDEPSPGDRENIEYAQADILALGSLGRSFDVIESSGVLHLTLAQIAGFLAENNLRFIGFELEPSVMRQYLSKIPADTAMIDLPSWDAFERENPDTFSAMYQLWGAEEIVMTYKATL